MACTSNPWALDRARTLVGVNPEHPYRDCHCEACGRVYAVAREFERVREAGRVGGLQEAFGAVGAKLTAALMTSGKGA